MFAVINEAVNMRSTEDDRWKTQLLSLINFMNQFCVRTPLQVTLKHSISLLSSNIFKYFLGRNPYHISARRRRQSRAITRRYYIHDKRFAAWTIQERRQRYHICQNHIFERGMFAKICFAQLAMNVLHGGICISRGIT